MNTGRRQFLAGLLAAAAAGGARAAGELDGLRFRVAADGWGLAGAGEVEAVLKSAAGVLWKYFQDWKREPFVVLRGREGPIVLYQRNVVGEIVMKLDTQDYLWCQFVYQFSHEFCHILSDRSLNGAMALPLLELFEGAPESWEAVAWLNRTPSPEGETFAEYLEKWRSAVPARHRSFVGEVMRRFGVEEPGAGAAGPSGPAHSRD